MLSEVEAGAVLIFLAGIITGYLLAVFVPPGGEDESDGETDDGDDLRFA